MSDLTKIGYTGDILRVDLTKGRIWIEKLDLQTVKKWVGGAGLAAKYLWEEIPPGVNWYDPENRLIWTTGPLAGTSVHGAATVNIAARSAMSGQAASSQANGFFGAYLKFQGYDGIIIQGQAPRLSYLLINNGQAEIRDAAHLAGQDFHRVENMLRKELKAKEHDVSIFGIGPAGERIVRFAVITGDRGHVVSKGGLGAVMGSKNLKCVVCYRGRPMYTVHNPDLLKEKAEELASAAKGFGPIYQWGSGGVLSGLVAVGGLPVKNYTTNLYPEHERMNGQYLRTHFKVKAVPCYRCSIAHVKEVVVTEGPYAGFVGEEPEYEQIAAWGPQIGATDLGATVMLGNEVDKLGLDCNEASWTIGWAMECYEKGVFDKEKTEGLDLSWGNVEAVKELLGRIAHREGKFADMLAEGVMRASRQVGGEACEWAIYGCKGNTPRTHDHRGATRWYELFDTCISDTSTLEATWGGIHPQMVDQPEPADPFSHEEVSAMTARFSGIRLFDDCVGVCRFASPYPKLVLDCFNATTGWNWTLEDAFNLGRRIMAQLRFFALRHGLDMLDEQPSVRYGSPPNDGPAKGVDIMAGWDRMRENYYNLIGWDPQTGKPLPETLSKLGLEELAKHI
ncbi:MAG: hypothetical protein JRJ60_18150 [Deltaproteobacteria bacterium]|nr:hypothetical protein [Deltaproteobacteria bacterium]